jgi:hypothetical protein
VAPGSGRLPIVEIDERRQIEKPLCRGLCQLQSLPIRTGHGEEGIGAIERRLRADMA